MTHLVSLQTYRRSSHGGPRLVIVTVLALAVALLAPQRAASQTIDRTELGVRAGVSLATVAFSSDDIDRGLAPGIVGGAFAVMPLPGALGLQFEGLYTQKGVKTTTQGFQSKLATDYLEVPVLIRWNRRGARSGSYFGGGAAPAWRLRARTVAEFGNASESIDIGDQVERLDVGIVGAAGIERGRWIVDARYTFGLRDIDKDRSDAVDMRHRVITVTAGWRF